MLLMQTYIYTSSPRYKQCVIPYPSAHQRVDPSVFRDPKWMRIFVGSLVLLNTGKSAIDMGFVYTRLTQDFGNFPAITVTNWRAWLYSSVLRVVLTHGSQFLKQVRPLSMPARHARLRPP
jgi:hypothetical protein